MGEEEHKIDTGFGLVSFQSEQLLGCCGITVIGEIEFIRVTDVKKLYDYFYNEILFGTENLQSVNNDSFWEFGNIYRDEDSWKVNKFVFSDATKHKHNKASIYNMCSYWGAQYGTVKHNPNSGNKIILFEVDRPRKKATKSNT